MKKTIFVFIVILAIVYISLTVLDKGDYKLEKQLWRLQKSFDKISMDPSVVPDKEFDFLVNKYKRLIDQYTESSLVPNIYLQIAKVYALARDFDASRKILYKAMELYPKNKNFNAEVLFNIAATFEAQQNKQAVLDTYNKIKENYVYTNIGMRVPIDLVNFYFRMNDSQHAMSALDDAIRFYNDTANKNSGNRLGFESLRLLASAYYFKKDWENSLKILQRILLEYADSSLFNIRVIDVILRSINTISVQQMNDPDAAIKIYKNFEQKYPRSSLNKYLNKMISALEKIKSKAQQSQK